MLVTCFLAACAAPTPLAPTAALGVPSPTVIGALPETPTRSPDLAPPTRAQPGRCTFPYYVVGADKTEEATLYRFDWFGEGYTLQTASGALPIIGEAGILPGARAVAILHNGPLPSELRLDYNFGPGAMGLYAGANGALEVRNLTGEIVLQRLYDPAGDIILPGWLDVVRVNRAFAPGGSFIMRVELAGAEEGAPIWTWERYVVQLGDLRYSVRVYTTGEVEPGFYTAGGAYLPWEGTVQTGPTEVTWSFAEGAADSGAPFSASTETSNARGDTTETFAPPAMEAFYQAVQAACGG